MIEDERFKNIHLSATAAKYAREMVGEVRRGAEEAFLTIPVGFRDLASVRVAEYYLRFGHNLKTPAASRESREVFDKWFSGESTPFSKHARALLEGFNLNIESVEGVSNSEGEIIVINQPNTGPLRGNWFKYLLNLAVAQRRNFNGNFENRWVQKDMSESPILKETPLGIQKRRLARMINKSCNTILVDPAAKGRANVTAVLDMRRHLTEGGVLTVCPEGQDHPVLGRGKSDSAELVAMLAGKNRDKAIVRPVAAWSKGDNLNLRFGRPIDTNLLYANSLRVADNIMVEIARLLPPEKRGVYRIAANS